jgi:hypothetical protein
MINEKYRWVLNLIEHGSMYDERTPIIRPYEVATNNQENVLAIAMHGERAGSGKIAVYRNFRGKWRLRQVLSPEFQEPNSFLGTSLSISNDGRTIVAGTINPIKNQYNKAGVYIFTMHDSDYIESRIIVRTSKHTSFGHSVAINAKGNLIVVGNPDLSKLEKSHLTASLVYKKSKDGWVKVKTINRHKGDPMDIGYSVALVDKDSKVELSDNSDTHKIVYNLT